MKRVKSFLMCGVVAVGLSWPCSILRAQDAKPSGEKQAGKAQPPAAEPSDAHAYSGMYTFLKDGEFLQLTVEDGGTVAGFISRFGDGESDKGEFLDQFFKKGKLNGNKLTFTTDVVHGVAFDFQGALERGEGTNRGEEAFFVLKGTLTQNVSDANKKVTSQSRPVVFKMFPEDGAPAPVGRK